MTQNQEMENDEYMDVNYMVKAQSIIDSHAQGEFNSSLFANQVRTAGVVLMKMDAQTTYRLHFKRSRCRWKLSR
jgi:phage portal protein BeeE